MIKEQTSQGEIIVDLPDSVKNIILKMSGGADSSLMAYLFAEYKKNYRPDLELIAITLNVKRKPYQIIYAQKVIDWIGKTLNIKFKDHITDQSGTDYSDESNGDDLYADDQWNLVNEAYHKHQGHAHCIGITRNPPVGSFHHLGLSKEYDESERDWERQPELPSEPIFIDHQTHVSIQPFVNVDKRAVHEIYSRKGLMDSLYPLTRSCESPARGRQIDIHCGECWWCAERLWGFGRLE